MILMLWMLEGPPWRLIWSIMVRKLLTLVSFKETRGFVTTEWELILNPLSTSALPCARANAEWTTFRRFGNLTELSWSLIASTLDQNPESTRWVRSKSRMYSCTLMSAMHILYSETALSLPKTSLWNTIGANRTVKIMNLGGDCSLCNFNGSREESCNKREFFNGKWEPNIWIHS